MYVAAQLSKMCDTMSHSRKAFSARTLLRRTPRSAARTSDKRLPRILGSQVYGTISNYRQSMDALAWCLELSQYTLEPWMQRTHKCSSAQFRNQNRVRSRWSKPGMPHTGLRAVAVVQTCITHKTCHNCRHAMLCPHV
jgi:hypothetical protein